MFNVERASLYKSGIAKISEALIKTFPNEIVSIPYLRKNWGVFTTMEEVCNVLKQLSNEGNSDLDLPTSFYKASQLLGENHTIYANLYYTTVLILRNTLLTYIPETDISDYLSELGKDEYSELLFTLMGEREVKLNRVE